MSQRFLRTPAGVLFYRTGSEIGWMRAATWNHCTVTLVDPLAQEFPDVTEAVIVVVPVPTKVASPGVVDEKVTTEVFPELHEAEFVTSTPF